MSLIEVDRLSKKPMLWQVYEQFRIRILHGELKAEERLPSTRELASELQVARIVVLEAYNRLLEEG